jgi:hypothetical protein
VKILVAGPWVGEFGWELFCWQGYIRNLSKDYDRTVIISRKGHKFLYEDFCDKYIEYNSPVEKANMWLGTVDQNFVNKVLKEERATHHQKPFNIGYSTSAKGTAISNQKFNSQKFHKYEANGIDKKYDIILHARNKFVGSVRNWDYNNWNRLVGLLKKDYSIATVGTKEAFGFEGIDDYRNVVIEDTVSLFNRTKLVVGQSSGALHLASLSGAPHFVWSDHTNELRYKEHWNPFKTKVYFYDKEGWNPEVESIYKKIDEIL